LFSDKRKITDGILFTDKLKGLHTNFKNLCQIFDLGCKLVDLLVSEGCISEGHRAAIMSKNSDVERKEELLCILERRSLAVFSQIVECLEASQNHVAAVLKGNGGK